MALSVKHAFTSSKSDGLDTTKVQPSNWNAQHTLTAAIDKVLGTDSGSTTVKELSVTAAGRALLDDADAAAQRATLSVASVPIGGVLEWYTGVLPTGDGVVEWGWVNGQAISRATYSTLFTMFSTSFGAGNGSTTFNIPDRRETVPMGRSDIGGVSARGLITHISVSGLLGTVVGSGTHTLITAELATHGHAFAWSGTTGGESNSHTHALSIGVSVSGTTSSDGDHSHTYDQPSGTFTAGAGALKGSNINTGTSTSTAGAHQHTVTSTGTVAGNTGVDNAGHTHEYSGASTTSNAGSGSAHNNVQPSTLCWYIMRLK